MINDAKRPRPRKVCASADQGQAQGLKLGTSWSFVSFECTLHFVRARKVRASADQGPKLGKGILDVGVQPH